MKRTFLKVLPFAAALLLATSCSKDDNNSTDEIVNGGEQIETVTKTVKTLTIKGKVKQSISKVTTNSDETALAFEENDVFTFGSNTDDVYGTINFTNTDGSYTATINYTDESKLLTESFSASLGTNPATISEPYDNLATAVKNAYYTIDFTITQNEGEYKLNSGDASDIVVNLQSAFIKALSAEETTLGGTPITVEADKYYVVPVGKAMGTSENNTLAGKIYNLGTKVFAFTVNAEGKKVVVSPGNLQYNTSTHKFQFAANQLECMGTNQATIKDFFGWGMWLDGTDEADIIKTSKNYSDYSPVLENGVFKNNKTTVVGTEWYTLTAAEWTYIKTNSPNEWKEITVGGNTYKGLVILPDECTYVKTDIATTDWSELETAGAVFLPAAGYRDDTVVKDVGSDGGYWSATPAGDGAQYFYFGSGGSDVGPDLRYHGSSVRLVRSLQ